MKYLIPSLSVLLLSASLSYGYTAWGIHASYWDTDEADSAAGGGVKISFEMVPAVQMELRGTYFEDFNAEGVDVEVLPLEAGLALVLPVGDQTEWLAGGGLSYLLVDSDADPDDDVGFYLTTGLEWLIQPQASLFGEVMYRVADADDVGPNGEDADLNGIGINAGLLIRW